VVFFIIMILSLGEMSRAILGDNTSHAGLQGHSTACDTRYRLGAGRNPTENARQYNQGLPVVVAYEIRPARVLPQAIK
jgi:hypothetical protein